MNRIAVIHMGAIGDLVQAMPTLRAVRARWPEAHVTLISRPERAVLARMAGVVDVCLDYDSPRRTIDAELLIDFLGAPLPVCLPAGGNRVILPPLPPADCPEPAAEWIYHHAAEHLELPAVPLVPEIPVPEETIRSARAALEAAGVDGRFVAIHPGSGSLKKNWPLDRFIEITGRLSAAGRRPVWLSGPAERDRGTLAGAAAHTVLADLPLDSLAGVLAMADAYVGNDSGVTQVAAAVGRPGGGCTPVVTLFGPSNAAGWAPRGKHVSLVKSETGAMEAISIETVWQAIVNAFA
jgi:heptosyltransferase III